MKTLLISIVLIASIAHAGGDLINNGGGIAEKNVLYAYQKLDNYIKLCLSSDLCKVNTLQRSILQKINEGMAQERQNLEQIQFDSEKANPGFFIIDGEVKVAKTGGLIGSPIFINTDLLYTRNELGFFIPLSISESVAILVHELGHHYGIYAHTDLDLTGVRVALMLQHKTYSTPLLPWSEQISAVIINRDVDTSYPDILLYVEDQAFDLSQQFKDAVFCPKFFIPIPFLPDIPLSTKKPVSTLAHNVHWSKLATNGSTALLSIRADLAHKCQDADNNSVRSQDFLIKIDFSLTMGPFGKWTLDNNSIKLEQSKRSTLTGK